MSEENKEIVQGVYDAWQRGDFEVALEPFHEDIEWFGPPDISRAGGGGLARGHEGVRRAISRARLFFALNQSAVFAIEGHARQRSPVCASGIGQSRASAGSYEPLADTSPARGEAPAPFPMEGVGMRKLIVAALASLVVAAFAAGPASAARNPSGTGQPGAECGAPGATSEPAGFLTTGFANAEEHYAGSEGTPSAANGSSHAVSQYDVACFQVTSNH